VIRRAGIRANFKIPAQGSTSAIAIYRQLRRESPLKEPRRVKFERGPRSVAVIYVKGVLSGVAAIFVALLGPGLLQALKSISGQQATGLGAIAGGFWNPLFSPVFWILAISSFVLFLGASRLGSKVLRVVLF
jgi:hypothetical protein